MGPCRAPFALHTMKSIFSQLARVEPDLLTSMEAQLRTMLNMIPAYTWYATPAGALTFVNERSADYGGLPKDHPLRVGSETDAAWDSHIEWLHPDDHEETRKVWSTCIKTGIGGEVSFRARSAAGTYRWFLSRAEPLRSSDGSLLYWIGINLDIEERKQAENELRQILNLTPNLIAVLGTERERLYANQLALAYFDVSLEAWKQRSVESEVHPDDAPQLSECFTGPSANGIAYEREKRLRSGGGDYRWHLVRYSPVLDPAGKILRWYVACTDIDERKRAEERLQQENVALREEIDKTSMFEEIVGVSPALTAVLSRVSKVAASDSTVLITGETGTGKELVARAIHRRSARSSKPFVAVNCAAIPRELIASELFGHEKGSFTGATQRRIGRFELADEGTLFLDEIGELSSDTQAALLRMLQEREFERVGGTQRIRVNVRVIAATNRDLEGAVEGGSFRQDLFYRLNVFPVQVPPLRERSEDIRLLMEYFIERFARKSGKTFRRVSRKTLEGLLAYPWPGNVRELQNVIERSVIVSETDNFEIDESWLSGRPAMADTAIASTLRAQERAIIEQALRASDGRVAGPAGAAARLGLPRSTLESKIRALKISKSRFRPRPAKQ
jgi:PAS domain S-box-containing protein